MNVSAKVLVYDISPSTPFHNPFLPNKKHPFIFISSASVRWNFLTWYFFESFHDIRCNWNKVKLIVVFILSLPSILPTSFAPILMCYQSSSDWGQNLSFSIDSSLFLPLCNLSLSPFVSSTELPLEFLLCICQYYRNPASFLITSRFEFLSQPFSWL